ncbi:MAG: threonine aldolase, partial [Phycisphaeraceae bacterium]|nr:threonine aldolase [Phycisphaeraceae bacterium]
LLAEGVDAVDGLVSENPVGGVRTNIVFFDVEPALATAEAFATRMTEAGVAAYAFDPTRVRMVTHLDVDADGIHRAIATIGEIAAGFRA